MADVLPQLPDLSDDAAEKRLQFSELRDLLKTLPPKKGSLSPEAKKHFDALEHCLADMESQLCERRTAFERMPQNAETLAKETQDQLKHAEARWNDLLEHANDAFEKEEDRKKLENLKETMKTFLTQAAAELEDIEETIRANIAYEMLLNQRPWEGLATPSFMPGYGITPRTTFDGSLADRDPSRPFTSFNEAAGSMSRNAFIIGGLHGTLGTKRRVTLTLKTDKKTGKRTIQCQSMARFSGELPVPARLEAIAAMLLAAKAAGFKSVDLSVFKDYLPKQAIDRNGWPALVQLLRNNIPYYASNATDEHGRPLDIPEFDYGMDYLAFFAAFLFKSDQILYTHEKKEGDKTEKVTEPYAKFRPQAFAARSADDCYNGFTEQHVKGEKAAPAALHLEAHDNRVTTFLHAPDNVAAHDGGAEEDQQEAPEHSRKTIVETFTPRDCAETLCHVLPPSARELIIQHIRAQEEAEPGFRKRVIEDACAKNIFDPEGVALMLDEVWHRAEDGQQNGSKASLFAKLSDTAKLAILHRLVAHKNDAELTQLFSHASMTPKLQAEFLSTLPFEQAETLISQKQLDLELLAQWLTSSTPEQAVTLAHLKLSNIDGSTQSLGMRLIETLPLTVSNRKGLRRTTTVHPLFERIAKNADMHPSLRGAALQKLWSDPKATKETKAMALKVLQGAEPPIVDRGKALDLQLPPRVASRMQQALLIASMQLDPETETALLKALPQTEPQEITRLPEYIGFAKNMLSPHARHEHLEPLFFNLEEKSGVHAPFHPTHQTLSEATPGAFSQNPILLQRSFDALTPSQQWRTLTQAFSLEQPADVSFDAADEQKALPQAFFKELRLPTLERLFRSIPKDTPAQTIGNMFKSLPLETQKRVLPKLSTEHQATVTAMASLEDFGPLMQTLSQPQQTRVIEARVQSAPEENMRPAELEVWSELDGMEAQPQRQDAFSGDTNLAQQLRTYCPREYLKAELDMHADELVSKKFLPAQLAFQTYLTVFYEKTPAGNEPARRKVLLNMAHAVLSCLPKDSDIASLKTDSENSIPKRVARTRERLRFIASDLDRLSSDASVASDVSDDTLAPHGAAHAFVDADDMHTRGLSDAVWDTSEMRNDGAGGADDHRQAEALAEHARIRGFWDAENLDNLIEEISTDLQLPVSVALLQQAAQHPEAAEIWMSRTAAGHTTCAKNIAETLHGLLSQTALPSESKASKIQKNIDRAGAAIADADEITEASEKVPDVPDSEHSLHTHDTHTMLTTAREEQQHAALLLCQAVADTHSSQLAAKIVRYLLSQMKANPEVAKTLNFFLDALARHAPHLPRTLFDALPQIEQTSLVTYLNPRKESDFYRALLDLNHPSLTHDARKKLFDEPNHPDGKLTRYQALRAPQAQIELFEMLSPSEQCAVVQSAHSKTQQDTLFKAIDTLKDRAQSGFLSELMKHKNLSKALLPHLSANWLASAFRFEDNSDDVALDDVSASRRSSSTSSNTDDSDDEFDGYSSSDDDSDSDDNHDTLSKNPPLHQSLLTWPEKRTLFANLPENKQTEVKGLLDANIQRALLPKDQPVASSIPRFGR